MKKIKFRLVKNGKIVGYEIHNSKGQMITIYHQPVNGEKHDILYTSNGDKIIRHTHKDALTAITDMDGELEVYENDLIRCEYADLAKENGSYFEEKVLGLVRLTSNSFDVEILNQEVRVGERNFVPDSFAAYMIFPETVEVVGNVYEDADMVSDNLLREKEDGR